LSSVTDYPEKMTELPARGSEIEGGEALAPTPKALLWLGHLQDMAAIPADGPIASDISFKE